MIKNKILKKDRIAIFANFDINNKIQKYVVYYLKELKKVADTIIFVSDCEYSQIELQKIDKFVSHTICKPHGEYDFGSYKRGFLYAKEHGLFNNCKELILCNDSCYGPIYSLENVFDKMNKKQLDFWGITANTEGYIPDNNEYIWGKIPHVQSYFITLNIQTINIETLSNFFISIKKEIDKKSIIYNYEEGLTKFLEQHNYKWDAYCNLSKKYQSCQLLYAKHIIVEDKCPFLKTSICRYKNKVQKVFAGDICDYISKNTTYSIKLILEDLKDKKINRAFSINSFINKVKKQTPYFSIIMPTYNKAFCIENAIDSLLAQTYYNYELIIVDDGSSDNTEELIKNNYEKELHSGKIIYKKLEQNAGVCNARNVGLSLAKYDWIGYLDSDNKLTEDFLTTFSNAIVQNPRKKCFYAKIEYCNGRVIGKNFDFKKLCKANYIDLGVFVHHKSLVKKLGNFDTNLKRVVDWDLIIRYTRKNKPVFINKVLLNYNSNDDFARITNSESAEIAVAQVYEKIKNYRDLNYYLQKIFSLENEGTRKVITFLGIKLKIKSKKLAQRKRLNSIDNKINNLTQRISMQEQIIQEQNEKIEMLQETLNQLQHSESTFC